MIIRATKKILSISKIKPIANTNPPVEPLPGEWYANLISLLRPGRLAIHFLHYPTYISIVIPGKSINKAIVQLPDRIENLLSRNGFGELIAKFQLDSKIEIYTTNSRAMLGYLNNMKYDLEYQCRIFESTDGIDYQKIEDIEMDYLFGGKNIKGYRSPKETLIEFLK